jgi:predicted transcriptional regulator
MLRPEDIRQFRRGYELSQQALANLVGVSGNYIYMVEKG